MHKITAKLLREEHHPLDLSKTPSQTLRECSSTSSEFSVKLPLMLTESAESSVTNYIDEGLDIKDVASSPVLDLFKGDQMADQINREQKIMTRRFIIASDSQQNAIFFQQSRTEFLEGCLKAKRQELEQADLRTCEVAKQLFTARRQILALEDELEVLEHQKLDLAERFDSFDRGISELTDQNNRLVNEHSVLEVRVDELQHENFELKEYVGELLLEEEEQSKVRTLIEADLNLQIQKTNTLTSENMELKDQLSQNDQHIKRCEEMLNQGSVLRDEETIINNELRAKIRVFQLQINARDQQIESFRKQVASFEVKSTIDNQRFARSSLEHSNAYNQVQEQLHEACNALKAESTAHQQDVGILQQHVGVQHGRIAELEQELSLSSNICYEHIERLNDFENQLELCKNLREQIMDNTDTLIQNVNMRLIEANQSLRESLEEATATAHQLREKAKYLEEQIVYVEKKNTALENDMDSYRSMAAIAHDIMVAQNADKDERISGLEQSNSELVLDVEIYKGLAIEAHNELTLRTAEIEKTIKILERQLRCAGNFKRMLTPSASNISDASSLVASAVDEEVAGELEDESSSESGDEYDGYSFYTSSSEAEDEDDEPSETAGHAWISVTLADDGQQEEYATSWDLQQ